ncbi:MAG: ribosome-associated translation inhibitor RaiA [Nitrospirae bacterium]|nr:ribosome-associated translation inhibitor RaiA [Nitrospirota bacterium]
MRITITGRHVKVTPGLRRYIETRMTRLQRYGAKVGDVQVVLGVEKYRHTAEAVLTLNGAVIQSKASTNEMHASLDQLLNKISRQVQKRKEKLIDHKSRAIAPRPIREPREAELEPLDVHTVHTPLHILTVAEAVGRLGGVPGALVVFINASSNRVQVVRRLDNGDVELIDPQPG